MHEKGIPNADTQTPTADASKNLTDSASPIPRWTTQTLFADKPLIEIEHRGDLYRLQITRQGKLILTK